MTRVLTGVQEPSGDDYQPPLAVTLQSARIVVNLSGSTESVDRFARAVSCACALKP